VVLQHLWFDLDNETGLERHPIRFYREGLNEPLVTKAIFFVLSSTTNPPQRLRFGIRRDLPQRSESGLILVNGGS